MISNLDLKNQTLENLSSWLAKLKPSLTTPIGISNAIATMLTVLSDSHLSSAWEQNWSFYYAAIVWQIMARYCSQWVALAINLVGYPV